MYLTRFALNPARRQCRFLLGSPQAMHAAVMAGFPPTTSERSPDGGRVLWRVDRDGPSTWLYILSPTEPQLTHVAEQAGWSDSSTWSTKSYAPLLDQLEKGQSWAFRLHANPVHQITRPDGKRIKVGHVTAQQQQQWLLDKAGSIGFSIPIRDDSPAVDLSNRQHRTFRRGQGRVTLTTAQFDGVLVVDDSALLRTAMIQGIGRAKGYGCGLMTLAQARL